MCYQFISWSDLILAKKISELDAIWIANIVFHILLEIGFIPFLGMFGNLLDEQLSYSHQKAQEKSPSACAMPPCLCGFMLCNSSFTFLPQKSMKIFCKLLLMQLLLLNILFFYQEFKFHTWRSHKLYFYFFCCCLLDIRKYQFICCICFLCLK